MSCNSNSIISCDRCHTSVQSTFMIRPYSICSSCGKVAYACYMCLTSDDAITLHGKDTLCKGCKRNKQIDNVIQ